MTITRTSWEGVSGEVRAEMARQRRTVRELMGVLALSRTAAHRRYEGLMPYRTDEIFVIADWLGVSVARFMVEEKAS